MKSNKNLSNLIYTLSAIIIFSYAATSQKSNLYGEKSTYTRWRFGKLLVLIFNCIWGKLCWNKSKIRFYIVTFKFIAIKIVIKFWKLWQSSKKYFIYFQKFLWSKVCWVRKTLINLMKEVLKYSISNIERLVELELFIQGPDKEYNKIVD